MEQQDTTLTEKNTALTKRVILLAWPAIFENIMLSMVEYIDTAMVGSLGASATAAIAINNPILWMMNAVMMAVAVGGTVMTARFVGADDEKGAQRVTGQAFLMVLVMSSVLSVLLFSLSGRIPAWMGAKPEIMASSAAYLRIRSACFIPQFTQIVLAGILRGAGDTKTPMCINLLMNVVNIAGNFFLIFSPNTYQLFGHSFRVWGAGMGVVGAAAASSLSMAVAGIILFCILTFRKSKVQLRFSEMKPDRDTMRRMFSVGVPTALERLATSGGQLMFIRIVTGLGTVSLAAHQLAVTAESISYMPAYGFQAAATTLVGQALGAGSVKLARKYGNISFYLCTACMVCMSSVLFFGSEWLISLFTPEAEVIVQGGQALRIVAAGEIFFGAALVLTGALRGAGDTKQPFYACLITMWGIRLPAAFIMVNFFHWGLRGAWCAMVLDLTTRGVLMFLRFRSDKWEKITI